MRQQKTPDINHFLTQHEPDFMLIAESALFNTDRPQTTHDDYKIAFNFPSDGKSKLGQGILILCKKQYKADAIFPQTHSPKFAAALLNYNVNSQILLVIFHLD